MLGRSSDFKKKHGVMYDKFKNYNDDDDDDDDKLNGLTNVGKAIPVTDRGGQQVLRRLGSHIF
jgi:hypothetical protein